MPNNQPSYEHAKRDGSGYLSGQTIAALATAVGGAISIIRISGPQAFGALNLLTGEGVAESAEPRKMTRTLLHSPDGEALDDAVFVCFKNPESFTGEDVVELHIHGGSFSASRILALLSQQGFRQALPGEFSFRAVRNGKMSLSQAQAVSDLIKASSEDAVSLALEKLSGSQNKFLATLAKDLRNLCVLGEVGIDFADQNVQELELPALKVRVATITKTLEHLQSSFERGSKLQDGVSVAIVGRPNAGKSSFFNALLGEDRSIVSDIPGTTRDIVREKITLRGPRGSVTIRVQDTAGLRHSAETEDSVEKQGIERSVAAARVADMILFVADAETPDLAIQEWENLCSNLGSNLGASASSRAIGILSKTDLVSSASLPESEAKLKKTGIQHWAHASSVTGEGLHQAATLIATHCSRLVGRERGEILLTRLDQVNAVSDAISHLARASSAPEIDLFASDIRQALHSLGLLIGETLPDDILGKIFSDFCIGK